MQLEILTYPNKKLFEKSVDVTVFDEELGKFLDDMYETMIANGGIGLAAIQVGRPIRVLILNLINENDEQDKADLIEVINPTFVLLEGEQVCQEGCLSIPGYYEEVKRAERVVVEFFDRHGVKQTLDATGLLAVAIQHENDHLEGRLFIEKIPFQKRKLFDKEFKKNGFKNMKNNKKRRKS